MGSIWSGKPEYQKFPLILVEEGRQDEENELLTDQEGVYVKKQVPGIKGIPIGRKVLPLANLP